MSIVYTLVVFWSFGSVFSCFIVAHLICFCVHIIYLVHMMEPHVSFTGLFSLHRFNVTSPSTFSLLEQIKRELGGKMWKGERWGAALYIENMCCTWYWCSVRTGAFVCLNSVVPYLWISHSVSANFAQLLPHSHQKKAQTRRRTPNTPWSSQMQTLLALRYLQLLLRIY